MSRIPRLPGPVAFVFTSGGARSAAQVGMVEELLSAGIVPDLVTGASLGALNAAAMASDPTSAAEKLRSVWELIGTESALSSVGAAAVAGLSTSRAGKASAKLREIVAAAVPDVPIQQLPIPLTVVASDLDRGVGVELRAGSALDAVMASSALPVIFPPVEFNGTLLVDGGLFAGAPIAAAEALGAKTIILLDTGASAVPEAALASMRWWQIAALAYTHIVRGQLGHDLGSVAASVPVLCISTDCGSILDFDEPSTLMSEGSKITQTFLARVPAVIDAPGIYGVPLGFNEYAGISALIREA